MDKSIGYSNMVERRVIVQEQEALGLRMKADDFTPDWRPGEEPRGVLTFTDAPEPPFVPTPEQVARQARRARMRQLIAKGGEAWTAAEAREATELVLREMAG